jgi:uncharacterized protein (TIGR02217 family)
MAFLETPRLSPLISFGARGGPGFQTDVVSVRAGYESRNGNWSQTRHRYEIGLVPRVESEFNLIRNHFMAVRGRLDGFRYKDWADFEVTTANGYMVALHGTEQVGTGGVGYGTPTAQLSKLYQAGANYYLRDIRKPVVGTLILYRGGSPVTAGVGAGQYAIDTTTGVVTIVADQSRGISSHTVGATHVFTLASAFSPNLAIGGRIYVTGVTGTAATLLNGKSHAVTNVSSAVITTSTVTTGLTASGGTAYFYPQPTETYTFSCEFDVPVRFDVDQFDAVILDRQGAQGELIIELPSVPIIEIRV